MSAEVRTGIGYDTHAFLESGGRLVVGGVEMPGERGLAGHSDADVVAHAVTDALLGAAGLGDIGDHFPDHDERWAGADSIELLAAMARLVASHGLRAVNADVTVVAEQPRIAPLRDAMAGRLAAGLGIEADRVNVKATTNERMGFVGRGEGIAALAVVTLSGERA